MCSNIIGAQTRIKIDRQRQSFVIAYTNQIKRQALPYIEWVNIQMLATEVTENTEVFSFVGAASAANSSRSDGLFAAKAAPTFTVVQIKTTK